MGMLIFALVSAAVSYAVSYLTAPDGPDNEGARSSGDNPQNILGETVPEIYGTAPVIGKEIWRLNNELIEVTVKTENEGGKGGPDPGTTTTYEYYFTGADLIGKGEVVAIRRIWADTTLIYDASSDDLESIIASNQQARQFTLYTGDAEQLPSPLIEAEKGAGNVPGYRGMAYVTWDTFAVEEYGNRKPRFKYEVVKKDNGKPEQIGETVTVSAHYYGGAQHSIYKDKRVIVANTGSAPSSPYWAHGKVYYYDNYDQFTWSYFNRKYNAETQNWDITSENGVLQTHFPACSCQLDAPGYVNGHTLSGAGLIYINEFDGAGMILTANYRVANGGATGNVKKLCKFDNEAVALSSGGSTDWKIEKDFNLYGSTTAQVIFDLGELGAKGVDVAWQGGVIYLLDTDWFMRELDPNSGEIIDTYQIPNLLPTPGNQMDVSYIASKIHDGFIWYYGRRNGSGAWGILTKWSIAERRIIRAFLDPVGFRAAAGPQMSWDVVDNVLHTITLGEQSRTLSMERWNLEPVPKVTTPLSEVIGDIWSNGKRLSQDDMVLDELTDDVGGYVTKTGDIRKHTEPLQQAYRFDVVERDYKLRAIKRGQPPVAIIPIDDIAAHSAGGSPPVSLKVGIAYDKDLPQKCEVTHLSYEREYDNSVQTATRLSTPADNILKITWPIVLTDQQAADAAQVNLYSAWVERQTVEISLPLKYLYLEPTDVVTIDAGGQGRYELRIIDIDYGASGVIVVRAITQEHATYKPNAEPQNPGAGGNTGVSLAGDTITVMIDAPLMDEAANSPGWLCATTGQTNGWPGGLNYRSVDGGQTYTNLNSFGKNNRCTIGRAINTLESTDPAIWYRGPALQYRKIYGDIYSITDEQLLAGGNLFAWGDVGRWEIIQAKTAVMVDDRNIDLSDIRRGQYGTARHMESHLESDLLVKIDPLTVQFVQQTTGDINAERLIKTTTKGDSLSSAEPVTFSNRCENLKPQPPVYLRAYRPAKDWQLSFIPQTRYGAGNWWRGLPVPVGETTEKYKISIISGGQPVRTWEQAEKTVIYSEADQIVDFGGVQNTITFNVAQWSDIMGYGYSAEHTA